ncbi:hypothetical protein Scep_030454 [Stephania cephalantha]|uniref:Uncharacterized protein n=1 Tax=Stephania cephalantha TaxID=152367 RepID=A0AAP0HD58_9MAGN
MLNEALKVLHLSTMAIASNDSQLGGLALNINFIQCILRIASPVFINNVLLFYKDLIRYVFFPIHKLLKDCICKCKLCLTFLLLKEV